MFARVDLQEAASREQFSLTLYNELCGDGIRLPSLRERHDEIPTMANLMLSRLNIACSKSVLGFEKDAMRLLQEFPWP